MKNKIITRGWPPERRAAQAQRMRNQKPWLKSTGPRTLAGKKIVSQNAVKHNRCSARYRKAYRDLSTLLRVQKVVALRSTRNKFTLYPSLRAPQNKGQSNLKPVRAIEDCHVMDAPHHDDNKDKKNMNKHSGKNPAIYIMCNKKEGVLYIGVTSNLPQRVYQHKTKEIKGFSSKYNCDRLVYFENFDTMENAIIREKQLKSGPRKTKINLIEQDNSDWKDLYEFIH